MENAVQKGDAVTEPQNFIQSCAAYLSHRTGFQDVTSYTQSRMFSIDYSSEPANKVNLVSVHIWKELFFFFFFFFLFFFLGEKDE